jgi:hypothetical protein
MWTSATQTAARATRDGTTPTANPAAPVLASLAKGRKNCGKTNREGQFGGQTAGTREQKIWTQSHITLMELRDV